MCVCVCFAIYTETKKFSNTSQIRIFITEIHVEINTNLIIFFGSKCNYNLIQYLIIFFGSKCNYNLIQYQIHLYCTISFLWSAVPVIKCFSKDKMSIFWTFSTCIGDGSAQFLWTLTNQRQFLDVIQSGFAVRNVTRLDVIWIKRASSGVSFLSVCPVSGDLQPTLFARNDWLLGHRSQRLQWPIVIMRCPASIVCRPSVCLSYVRLFTFSTSSPEPLDGFWWNLVWIKYSRSLTSVVVFRPDPSRGGSRAGQK